MLATKLRQRGAGRVLAPRLSKQNPQAGVRLGVSGLGKATLGALGCRGMGTRRSHIRD
jgi:hypothetical protein